MILQVSAFGAAQCAIALKDRPLAFKAEHGLEAAAAECVRHHLPQVTQDKYGIVREYRRDVGRYFRGETAFYPSMPQGYFDRDIAAALTLLREKAIRGQGGELFPAVSAALAEAKIENSWHASATNIYRNWLRYICAQKAQRPARSTVMDLEQVS